MKFASVPVTDQDRAVAFYTEKLGFRIATDQPFDDRQRWIELKIDGAETEIVLFRYEGGPEPGTRSNVTFWTEHMEDTVRELKARGVEFVMEPETADWGTAAAFKDPDGNVFIMSSR